MIREIGNICLGHHLKQILATLEMLLTEKVSVLKQPSILQVTFSKANSSSIIKIQNILTITNNQKQACQLFIELLDRFIFNICLCFTQIGTHIFSLITDHNLSKWAIHKTCLKFYSEKVHQFYASDKVYYSIGNFHKSAESFISYFHKFCRYLVKNFKCWEKMDVIRDFFINYRKTKSILT